MTTLAGVIFVAFLLSPLLLAGLAAWDMDRRGEMGWVYGLFVFFCFPVGLVVWIVAALWRPVLGRSQSQTPPSRRRSPAGSLGGVLVVVSGVLFVGLGGGLAPIIGASLILFGSLAAVALLPG
jgi:hypothetical protein